MKAGPVRFSTPFSTSFSTALLTSLALLPMAVSLFPRQAQAADDSARRHQPTACQQAAASRGSDSSASAGRDDLPAEAKKLLDQLEQTKAFEVSKSRLRTCLERLQQLQDSYTRTSKLDDAVTLRDAVLEYKARLAGVRPDPGVLTQFRGQLNQTFTFSVTGRRTGSVYGTQIYTDDSDLGSAAVHAGLLAEGQKGVLKVTVLAGQDHYDGSVSNGISSLSYEHWDGSYVIDSSELTVKRGRSALPAVARNLLDELEQTQPNAANLPRIRIDLGRLQKLQETYSKVGKLDEAVAIRDGVLSYKAHLFGAQPDPGTLTQFRGQAGQTLYIEVLGRQAGSVWGSAIYTDHSELKAAAVHAGVLREGERNLVKVTILPGNTRYEGSERNGVTSRPYGSYEGSYRVEGVKL